MAVQRRQSGVGVPRAGARRRPGPANTPEEAEQAERQNPTTRRASTVRSRGTARTSRADVSGPVQSDSVEPDSEAPPTSEPDTEPEDDTDLMPYAEFEDEEDEEVWQPDALDEQIQEELAEEFERTRAPHTHRKDTRRVRAGAPHNRSTMPDSGVVPPVADGMHTMDGQAAVPITMGSDPVDPDESGQRVHGDHDGLPPMQARYRRNMDPTQIYRGRNRLALIRDLAMGEWTDASIAQSIGVPYDVIVDFRLTYETEISEVRLALANQLAIESAGMWISKRQNRIAEMQEDYEDIDLVLAVMRENTRTHLKVGMDGSDSQVRGDVFDTNMLLGSRRHQNLLRSKLAIMKAVSDELSPRNKEENKEDDSRTIRYVIEQDGESDDIISSLT